VIGSPRVRRWSWGLAAACALAAAAVPAGAHTNKLGFRKPIFVDTQLAGSEGFVMYSAKSRRLIYVTHEGTTLLYKPAMTESPRGDADFAGNYRNQVNLWTSKDDGRTWQRADWNGTGFFTPPGGNLGFSDPDITTDAGGTVYITGIDLANDALVSSPDGGKTWPTGTVQCHEGDRPWLAGGPRLGSVFLADNSEQHGHIIVRSTDSGASCSSDYATGSVGAWTGYGKILYDAGNDTIYEAAISGPGNGNAVGIVALPHATKRFDRGKPGTVVARPAAANTSFNAFWRAQLAQGPDHTLYLTWSTDDRKQGSSAGGCDGTATPAANSVMLTSSRDGGRHWTRPVVVAHPGVTVNWPWITAGTEGRVAVAWYQYDRIVDLNCAPANAAMGVRVASIAHADGDRPSIDSVDPIGRPIHFGEVCTSGTACVATGHDRRLGEFFTIAQDGDGCVLIATGDTTRMDPVTGGPLPTARPLFTKQDSGRSLTGKNCART
jgi:hypothetical protein